MARKWKEVESRSERVAGEEEVSIFFFFRKNWNRIDTKGEALIHAPVLRFAQNLLHTDWNGSKLKVMRLLNRNIAMLLFMPK